MPGTVELALTGYDIMRGVERCKQEFNARKIAVILSENTVIEKEFIDRIMDVKSFRFSGKRPCPFTGCLQ